MVKKMHYAWWIMVSCGTISFCVLGIILACAGIFFKPVCDYLSVSRGAFSLYMTIVWLTMVLALPVAGKLLPTRNFRLLLSCSMTVFILAFVAMSQFNHLYHWYIAGVVLGISGAFVVFLPIPILINNWFKEKVGFAMGISLAMSGVGGAIFNPIGAWVIQNYGWRAGYLVLGLCAAAITLPFVYFVVRLKPSDLGMHPYGVMSNEVKENKSGLKELQGLSTKEALRTPAFYFTLLFAGLLTMSGTVQSHIPGYVNYIGLSPIVGGLAVSATSFGIIFGKLVIGYLNDKIGITGATTTGAVLGALGLVLMLAGRTNLVLLYSGSFIFGFGAIAMGTVQPPMVVRQVFGQKDFSSIYSNITSGTTLLMAFAMSFYGFIFDITKSYANSLIVALAFIIVAYLGYLLTSATGKKLYTS